EGFTIYRTPQRAGIAPDRRGEPREMRAVLIAWTAPTLKHFFACDLQRDFGDHSDGETPVPIPNTAVKPVSADGTGLATVWESRSSPRSLSFAWKISRRCVDGCPDNGAQCAFRPVCFARPSAGCSSLFPSRLLPSSPISHW